MMPGIATLGRWAKRGALAVVVLLVLAEVALRLLGLMILVERRRRVEHEAGPLHAAVRILHVGESTTFGLGVAPEEAYPAQLTRMLEERHAGRRFVSFNRGIPGLTTASMRAALPVKLRELQPDLVVVMAGVNDYNPRLNPVAHGEDSRLPARVTAVLERSSVYRLVQMALSADWQSGDVLHFCAGNVRNLYDVNPRDDARIAVVTADLEWNLASIVETCRAARTPVVLVGYIRSAEVNQIVTSVARRLGAPFIDTFVPRWPEREELFVADGWHPSALGHRLIAERIAEGIEPFLRSPARPAGESSP